MTSPGFTIGLRGICYFHVTVQTGERDLHSGMFGGVALNALHALMQRSSAVFAGPDGLLPEPLRAGIIPPTEEELESWRSLPRGEDELADQGATALDARAAEDFYVRTTAEPSVDVNGIEGGSPRLQKTVIPIEAQANVSMRLAPGQDPARDRAGLRAAAARGGARGRTLTSISGRRAAGSRRARIRRCDPARPGRLRGDDRRATAPHPLRWVDPDRRHARRARHPRGRHRIRAQRRRTCTRPNERLVADYVPLGVRTAQALFRRFADLG